MPPIEQNAPGFFYKVFWKRNDMENSQFQTRTISEWQKNEYVVENQETFKPYRIKVEAHNRKGQAHTQAAEVIGYSGEDGKTLVALLTKQFKPFYLFIVPEVSPKNFELVESKGAKSAIFSWEAVPPESIRGHFKGYKIQTWTPEETEKQLREQVVPPNVTRALVTIFKPFSTNQVRVLAFNEMYNGPASDTLELVTPEGSMSNFSNEFI